MKPTHASESDTAAAPADLLLAQNTANTGALNDPLEGVEDPAVLLQSMRDIHLPDASGSPLAPGWVLLAAGVLMLLLMLLGFLLRRRRSADWRAQAQQELSAIRHQASQVSESESVAACSRLLRRISLALAPRQKVASLTGESWLNLLDALHGSAQFSRGPGRVLAELPYRRPAGIGGKPADAGKPPHELLSLLDDFIAKAQPAQAEDVIGHDRQSPGTVAPGRQVADV